MTTCGCADESGQPVPLRPRVERLLVPAVDPALYRNLGVERLDRRCGITVWNLGAQQELADMCPAQLALPLVNSWWRFANSEG